jgi:outer membrane protein assembly factor BamA
LLVGSNFKKWGEVTFGYRWQHVEFSRDVGSEVLPEANDNVASLVVSSRVDTLDRSPFPRTGTRMEAGFQRAERALGGDVDFSRATFQFEQFISPTRRDTISFQTRVGTAVDTDLPEYEKFRLGGADTLQGYEWGELRGDHMAVAGVTYRRSVWRLPVGLVRELFLRASLSTGNTWESLDEIPEDLDLGYGGSFGVALDTVIGPVTLDFAFGDDGRSAVYFFAGYSF